MKKIPTTNQTLRIYWQHMWRYPHKIIGLAISLPLVVLAYNYLPPLILANVLNRLASGQYQPNQIWDSFGTPLVAYTVLLILGGPIGWRVVDFFNWKLEANVERDMAQNIYNNLLAQGANFHSNRFSGSLVSQTNKFLGAYIRFADTTIYQVIPMFAGIIFASLILLNRSPLFVAILLLFVGAYMISATFITRNVRHLNAKHAELESEQTGNLADGITNIMAVKSFAGGNYERQRFANATERTRKSLLGVMNASQKQMFFFSSFTSIIMSLSLMASVISVMVLKANVSTVFLILNYTTIITTQLFTFSNNSLRNYNRAFGDASEMTKILRITPEIQDIEQAEESHISNGAIQLNNVTFTHDGDNNELFNELSLSIKPGEKIGLVGQSGSGKTTLTRLLLRFSDIDGGEILIDGQNIAKIKQDDLRRNIAYVPQEPIMFHRSLEENIRYGQIDADENAVFKAAKVAHAHEFIEKLPKGYETLVGERGVKLSGGQRQRVAIARAMLKNAPVLVLDEATSALDSESEVLIQDALWKLMEGRTAIVIAHRLSTIQKMDRIVVLDKGQIAEEGTHKELLARQGVYANLWAHQSGGFIEE